MLSRMFHVNEKEPAYMRLNGVDTEVLASGGVQITPRYETNLSEEDVSFTYLLYDLSSRSGTPSRRTQGIPACGRPSKGGDYWIHVIMKDAFPEKRTDQYHRISCGRSAVTGISMDRDGHQSWSTTVTLNGQCQQSSGAAFSV